MNWSELPAEQITEKGLLIFFVNIIRDHADDVNILG